jgi:hypothetical protein
MRRVLAHGVCSLFSVKTERKLGLWCLGLVAIFTWATPQTGRADSILQDLKVDFDVTTVPESGDTLPQGIAILSCCFPYDGAARQGDMLVSNFGDKHGLPGRGATIMRITPLGNSTVFFHGYSGMGLTHALGTLGKGFVLVGNIPNFEEGCDTRPAGSLLVIDKHGLLLQSIEDPQWLDGPWAMAVQDQGDRAKVFISDLYTGSVTRMDLVIPDDGASIVVQSKTQIASGYLHRFDSLELAIGPAGLAYDPLQDVLFVTSTGDNAVFSIADAGNRLTDGGRGTRVIDDPIHLHGPVGIALAPEGHFLIGNGNDILEFDHQGGFISLADISAFAGIAFGVSNGSLHLAIIDPAKRSLHSYTVR